VRIEALSQHRFAEAFEALRDASDAYRATHGTRPAVCLINLGTAAQSMARHTFASNFFAAGGIATSASSGVLTAPEAVQAWRSSGAQLAVLCSTDAIYMEHVGTIAPALKQAGVAWLYLAGHPGKQEQTYRQHGIDDFIHLGSNALAVLRATLIRLGVLQS
jgi:methylmalonyl-CoA mutase